MSHENSKELRTNITSAGKLELSIVSVPVPKPKDGEVLIRVEATPINPSDLGLLLGLRSYAGGGFVIGRLNVELFVAQTDCEADVIATERNELNIKRRDIEKKVLEEAKDALCAGDLNVPILSASKEG